MISPIIIGVANLIGSKLADSLRVNGYAVVGIDNLSYGMQEQVPDWKVFTVSGAHSSQFEPLGSRFPVRLWSGR